MCYRSCGICEVVSAAAFPWSVDGRLYNDIIINRCTRRVRINNLDPSPVKFDWTDIVGLHKELSAVVCSLFEKNIIIMILPGNALYTYNRYKNYNTYTYIII